MRAFSPRRPPGAREAVLGKARVQRLVGRHRDHVRVVREEERAARVGAGAVHLDPRDGVELPAFHEDQVAGPQAPQLLLERGLGRAAKLVHERPALRGAHQDLRAAGLPVAPRILARGIDLERVVRVLDERHAQPSPHEERHELLDEGGLAAAAVAGDAEDLHGVIRVSSPK
jgi:hypothetical protein